MADTRQAPDRPVSSRAACDLCGLGLNRFRVEAAFGDRTYLFCCTGCRQVFTILIQAAGSADPASFRTTELFRRCQESGVIPRSGEELAGRTPAPEPAAPPTPPAAAGGLDLTLKIDSMWCPACAWLVETVVRQQPGVTAAACNFATDRLNLTYDPVRTSPQAIAALIQRFGYRALDPADARRGAESRRSWIRFGISAFLTMNVMMLSAALYFGFFTELPAESVASISWPMAAMAAAVLAYGGAPLAARAWRGLPRAAFSMETLVLTGALSAFGYSLAGLFSGSIHLYFDTASMLITLVLLGKMLEQRAKHRVLEGLERFLSLMPAKVRIVSAGFPDGRFAGTGQLAAGDLFRVMTGEIVAADGVVVAGDGSIEESALTGEPLPIAKKPGDSIRSGSRVRSGALTVCAGRVGAESTLGEMLAVVEKTLAEKTPGENRSERWLQGFVPGILGLAAATGGIVAWLGAGAAEAVLRAVTVTVIACPCALGIAIPLARASGVAIAARKGMLVRNFDAFERVEQLDTIVLDKTGTVTRGDWRLLQILTLGGIGAEQALALASGLERDAGHPVALEIVRAARDRLGDPNLFVRFEAAFVCLMAIAP
jgi:cation transport ATPase